MRVYVAVNILQGVICDVQVFVSKKYVQKIEQEWLKSNKIKTKIDRNCKAQNGTELLIFICELEF